MERGYRALKLSKVRRGRILSKLHNYKLSNVIREASRRLGLSGNVARMEHPECNLIIYCHS